MQLRNAKNLLPGAVLQQSTFNSKEEYSLKYLKVDGESVANISRDSKPFLENPLDVV